MSKSDLNRPSWNEYFMRVTDFVSNRSTCLKEKQGAILVRERRILTTGYNGAPAGIDSCLEVGCLRDQRGLHGDEKQEICRGLHAIQNAIIQAAIFGVSTQNSILYSTRFPCIICLKMLINSGIKEIYINGMPSFPQLDSISTNLTRDMLEKTKIKLEFITIAKE
ncbi:cytidine/deoxycytidylate deaminase family protein [bacterium]|nr:cytidine/deoxycytidylate deaminase family protein [bacterium]